MNISLVLVHTLQRTIQITVRRLWAEWGHLVCGQWRSKLGIRGLNEEDVGRNVVCLPVVALLGDELFELRERDVGAVQRCAVRDRLRAEVVPHHGHVRRRGRVLGGGRLTRCAAATSAIGNRGERHVGRDCLGKVLQILKVFVMWGIVLGNFLNYI